MSLKECAEGSLGFGFRLRVQVFSHLKAFMGVIQHVCYGLNCIFPQFYVEVPALRTSSRPIFRERTFKEIINLK